MAVDDKKSRTPEASPAAATNTRDAAGRSRRRPPEADTTREELQRALAELQVHQHELELQNEELRSIQQNLEAARERYQDLFEVAPVGYITLSDTGVIQEVNLTAAALLDRPRAFLEGRPFFSCVDPDHSALYREHFSQHRKGLGTRSLELRLIKGDGQRFWARLILRRAQDKEGRPDFRVMLSDISDLHNAEQAFRDTQLDLQRAQEMARIGVWRITDRGNVILCSDETYRILGIPKGADVNQAMLLAQVHPDEREWVAECRSRALCGKPYDIEHRLLVEGRTVWVREKAEPRVGDSRRRPDVFGTLQDISDIKAIEQSLRDAHGQLQESEARYRAVVESQTEMIARFRADGTVTYANPAFCRTFGQSAEALLGRRWQPLVAEDDVAAVEAQLAALSPANPIVRVENRFYDGERAIRWGQFVNLGFFDPDGALSEFQCVGRDITEQKHYEAALRDSEAKFSAAFMECPMGMAIMRLRDNRCIEVNRSMLETFELQPEEVIDSTSEDLKLWEDRALRADIFERLQREGTVRNVEASFTLRRSGRKRIMMGSVHRLQLVNEPHALVIANDVTEKHETETSLRSLQAELQMILDTLPAHIFYKDTQGRLLRVNRTVAEAWGLPKSQVEGHLMSELFPEKAAAFREADEAVIASGEPILGREDFLELPSGSARWLRTDLIPLKNSGEQVTGLLVMARDITERKLTEQELQRNRDDLARAQTVGKIGNWRLDGRTGALIWSAQTYRMFGIVPGTPMDYAGLLTLLPPEDADRLDQAWLQALAHRGCYVTEYRVEVDGEWYWLKETGELEFDADGEFLDAFGTVQDISDLKAAEEALRREDRLKDEFLATLAHELRNPLAPLRNGIRVLKMAGDDEDKRREVLALMEPQLLHMVRLLDDLLDMSRIRQGRIELHTETADLRRIIKGVVDAGRSLVEEAGHQLNLELPAQPVPISGDAVRLAQVLANLLNNAAKYTPRGGRIDLRLAVERGDAVVRVRDSGIGIPKDMLERVFDLFTQVDQTYQRGTGGLGIGLNLAKRLVEKHGGRIEALSGGKGNGSEFVVTLPLATGSEAAPEAPPLPLAPAGELRRHRVLVVDDNASIVDSLRLLLELLGQDVRCAHSGEEALHQFPSYRPELVLLDIGMPGLSGYDTCRRMRTLPWGRGATIVAMTGWAQERDVHNSRLAGFNRHLVKPVEPEILEQLLAALP
ncbi:PAS domain-containing hybrid sensor histidine kinase/response regulator [Methyloterricola oryzae]|uniref:PAS domain-containing hybrid sensor histidine kinase/response regulator n=1 Tax=Methyloterricola oryzae TaxID=1495050 RepID=UPI00069C9826|nr:PAS domain S-box protein [Methyloterricola oryzae]